MLLLFELIGSTAFSRWTVTINTFVVSNVKKLHFILE